MLKGGKLKNRITAEVSKWPAYLILLVLVYLVCSQVRLKGLFMDDISILGSYRIRGGFLGFVFGTGAYKLRPVSYFFLALGVRFCRGSTDLLWCWLIAVNYATALTVYYVFRGALKKDTLAFGGAVIFVLSRFGYYAAGQYFGIMEQVATAIAVLVLYCVLQMIDREDPGKFVVLASGLTFLAIFAHERYLSLTVLVALAALLTDVPIKKKLGYVAMPVAVLLVSVGLRGILFGSNAWAGTGGTDMVSGFSIGRVFTHILHGCLYLFGVNMGPDYMCGYTSGEVPGWIYALNIITWVILLVMLVLTLRKHKFKAIWKHYFLVIAFIGGTLIVGCATVRLELRWLYTPFAGIMLLWLMLLRDGIADSEKLKKVVPAVMLLCMAVIELFFHTGYGAIYYYDPQNVYNQIYELTWEANDRYLEGQKIVIIGNGVEHVNQKEVSKSFFELAQLVHQTPPEVIVYDDMYDFVYTGEEDIILSVDRTEDLLEAPSRVEDITDDITKYYETITPAGNTLLESMQWKGGYGWQGEYVWFGEEMSMRISTGETGKAYLRAHCPSFNLPNTLYVYYGGQQVHTYEITEDEFEIEFDMPANEEERIVLRLDHANIPYEIGVNEDRRVIGLCLYDLRIN